MAGHISLLITSPHCSSNSSFWLGWFFSVHMWLFSVKMKTFHVCILNRTLKNLFQFMFIALLFFHPTSFMFCLRSNTENNIVSLVNLSLHFQGWYLTSKSLLGTRINKLCCQNSTTDLYPRKMLTVRDRRKFCLGTCC